ncbi:MAG: hypothetical protein ACKVPX_18140 [Myxococcaceae bacterium]
MIPIRLKRFPFVSIFLAFGPLLACDGWVAASDSRALAAVIPQGQLGVVSVSSNQAEAGWLIDGDQNSRWLSRFHRTSF